MLTIRRTRTGSASLVIGFLLMTACHNYVPVTSQSVAPGRMAQVRLTDRGAADLAQFVGPYARVIEGRVASIDDSTIAMSVTELTRANDVTETWRGERVTVPRSNVAELSLAQFSKSRTGVLIAGMALVGVVAGAALGGGGGFGSSGGGRTGGGKQ